MTSDSSDEENLDLLKEAQDSNFINDSMFSDSPAKSTAHNQTKPLPSLRKTKNEEGHFSLKVTPEFRDYVARQLTSILDRKLDKKFADLPDPEVPRKKRKKVGVKLLSESKHFLELSEEISAENKASAVHNATAKRAKNSKGVNEVTEDLLKEVAVSGEDILSKKEVRNWSKRSKAPVFHYKKSKNGQLKLVEPEAK
ncbi:uncharacterized protein C12orf43 homolog [Anoplophora glabripennis]|uniref:uncharacterized protein C12orf43 homolog n=1 Tax=Anoplophora glabripennis TaxID=217634 RepID=UPI000873D8CE|nr:uncharacterized protein C12orf43 homolog [Anoplophora glabripennis]